MRILMVEDDKELSEAVCFQLKREGYEIDPCYTGEDVMFYMTNGSYDLVILDRMLPEKDGLTIMEEVRKAGIAVPVIMVTALNGIHDRIDGLDAGADDYLIKPFAVEELSARIRALFRRPRNIDNVEKLRYEDIVFDSEQKDISNGDKKISLSKKEAALMEYFMHNPGKVLSREQILAKVWGLDNIVEDGNIDNYIYFLRRRLKAIDSEVKIITFHRVGYRLDIGE